MCVNRKIEGKWGYDTEMAFDSFSIDLKPVK